MRGACGVLSAELAQSERNTLKRLYQTPLWQALLEALYKCSNSFF